MPASLTLIFSQPLARFAALTFGLVLVISGFGGSAYADYVGGASDSAECAHLLSGIPRDTFRNPGDEISYINRYNSCWAEARIMHGKQAERSAIGRSLEIFANPAAVEALGFSKQLCIAASSINGYRTDYPCWFETRTAQRDVSLELAAKLEVPKILFSTSQYNRDGSLSVEYILCTNDDPTKPKEYSKGCSRGKTMYLSEYGRGDINGDHEEDILVNIKYGDIGDDHKKCFIGAFTRRDGQLMHMFSFSPTGLCE